MQLISIVLLVATLIISSSSATENNDHQFRSHDEELSQLSEQLDAINARLALRQVEFDITSEQVLKLLENGDGDKKYAVAALGIAIESIKFEIKYYVIVRRMIQGLIELFNSVADGKNVNTPLKNLILHSLQVNLDMDDIENVISLMAQLRAVNDVDRLANKETSIIYSLATRYGVLDGSSNNSNNNDQSLIMMIKLAYQFGIRYKELIISSDNAVREDLGESCLSQDERQCHKLEFQYNQLLESVFQAPKVDDSVETSERPLIAMESVDKLKVDWVSHELLDRIATIEGQLELMKFQSGESQITSPTRAGQIKLSKLADLAAKRAEQLQIDISGVDL